MVGEKCAVRSEDCLSHIKVAFARGGCLCMSKDKMQIQMSVVRTLRRVSPSPLTCTWSPSPASTKIITNKPHLG